MTNLTVALGEYDTGWHDPKTSLGRAAALARDARGAGADLLVLPEMCISGFTMDAENFAEPDNGPSIETISQIAASEKLWIIAGAAMRDERGRFVNRALVLSPDGTLASSYEKQRLFSCAKENEIYSPGHEPCVVEINGVKLGVFICFDLRFPELFREVGPDVDAFVVIANWPETRQAHWDTLTRARAIENQCYMIAVNRIGEGGELRYAGGSVAYDAWGTRCDLPAPNGQLRIAGIASAQVQRARESFPIARSSDYAPMARRAK